MLSPMPGADFNSSNVASRTLSIPPKYLIKLDFNFGPNLSILSKLDEKFSFYGD